METKSQKNGGAILVIEKEFDAPLQSVFNALSDPNALSQWWGPDGYRMSVTKFDFSPKGLCLFKMENHEHTMWARFIYHRIISPELLEFVLSFSDEHGRITRAPFFENWPLEIMNAITLKSINGKTVLTNTCFPVNASAEEIFSFNENKASMSGGMSSSMDKLTKLLSEK
ncbi:MAG TPA: SRPBCC domain-containing protein [Bacteroidia bacterium]|nr:SRPBCC domain-containing protein [Bacteroidia bacterium]